jgi:DNA-binding CsgD family transcriptional regulator
MIVRSFAGDRGQFSKPFIALLAVFESILLSLLFVRLSVDARAIWFWDTVLMVARFAVCPPLVRIALEMNGIRLARLSPRAVSILVAIPLVAGAAFLFLDPVLHWYWESVTPEGTVLVAERGAVGRFFVFYCRVILSSAVIAFIVGITRHYGRERIRLAVFLACFAIMYAGDSLWLLGIELPYLGNALGAALALVSAPLAASVAFLGYPRAGEPVGLSPFAAGRDSSSRKVVSAGDSGSRGDAKAGQERTARRVEEVVAEIAGLSARQREIASLVVSGLTYRLVAERLGCAERTVKYHMGEILDKSGLETRDQFIAWVAARRVERD